jgi:N-acyl-D-aspartate/D-glutamate deacylase
MLKKIAKEMRHLRAEDLIVGQAPDHGFLTGISLKDFAEAHSIREPSFALLKLAQTTELRCLLFYRDIDERLLKRSLGSERSLIGSTVPDVAWGSWRPERMGYQAPLLAFSRFLELSSQGLMPMENAIKKITSVPARFFQMTGRGEIKEGFFADIAVFPMESFRHASDLIINGRMVMRGGEIIDRKAGRPIIIETGL